MLPIIGGVLYICRAISLHSYVSNSAMQIMLLCTAVLLALCFFAAAFHAWKTGQAHVVSYTIFIGSCMWHVIEWLSGVGPRGLERRSRGLDGPILGVQALELLVLLLLPPTRRCGTA